MASNNLPNVQEINQSQFAKVIQTSIKATHGNILVFAQSGAGKTEIAQAEILACGCSYIYISLPVLERTDLMGLPVINRDTFNVKYATPDFIPFRETVINNNITALESVVNISDFSPFKDLIEAKIAKLKKDLDSNKIVESKSVLQNEFEQEFSKFSDVIKLAEEVASKSPLVILFDEVDKAPPEVNQVLLEILQFKTINGRSLNLRCCVLTANLPDENAYSNNISHAITKRCATYKMNIEWEPFYTWASANYFDQDILDFLIHEQHDGRNSLYAEASSATEYALQSPRTWTLASEAKKAIEKLNLDQSEKDELIKINIAGYVGEKSAIQFAVFINHLKRFEKDITSILENGCLSENKTIKSIETSDLFIIGTSVMGKIYSKLKQAPKDINSYKSQVVNAFEWLSNLGAEDSVAIYKLSFGEDKKVIADSKLYEIKQVNDLVKLILSKKDEMDSQYTKTVAYQWLENKQAFVFAKFENRTSTTVSDQEIEETNATIRSSIQFKTLKFINGMWFVKSSSSKDEAIKEIKDLGFKENSSLKFN